MQFPNDNSNIGCEGLDRYLDGEMPAIERTSFAAHIDSCRACSIEVELHRGIGKMPEEIILPKDFSKVVATTAESQVSGLRKRKERNTALAIIAGLSVILFAVLGANLRTFLGMLIFGIEQVGSFLYVIVTFTLNLVMGVVVIVKVAADRPDPSNVALILIVGSFFAATFAYLFFTGRIAGLRDAKR